jgi:hypothetical protein
MRSFLFYTLYQLLLDKEIKENEIGRADEANGRDER